MSSTPHPSSHQVPSPYMDLDRRAWSRLSMNHPLSLDEADIERLAGLNEPIDLHEVEEVYLPLSRLLNFYVDASERLRTVTNDFLLERSGRTPFVIGVAGSVAVGKSTTARVLREMLARWPGTPSVQLLTTDGFLWPNEVLERRGLLRRKGFPESYDRRGLLRFLSQVKAGAAEVTAPVYSHLVYDIVPDERVVVRQPEVLIVEGLNVLQTPRLDAGHANALSVSDFFDFSVYVDARVEDIKRWYVERFLRLRAVAFAKPQSYFHRYAALSDEEAVATAERIWAEINGPNLVENIAPTRSRANLILSKGANHEVSRIRLRRI